MDKQKPWLVLTALAVVGVFAAGWFLLISPKRADAADARAQVTQIDTATAGMRTRLATLKAQAADLPAEQAKIAAVEARIPADPGLPALIRNLTAAATASGVELVSIVPGPPVAAAVPASTSASTSATTTTTGTTSATPAAGATSGADSLSSIGLTIVVVGSYFEDEQFLAALEDLPRVMRVSGVTVVPGDDPTVKRPDGAAPTKDGSVLSMTVVGKVFLAPGRPVDTAVVAPGPAGPAVPAVPAGAAGPAN